MLHQERQASRQPRARERADRPEDLAKPTVDNQEQRRENARQENLEPVSS
jgi:hypothetical protein